MDGAQLLVRCSHGRVDRWTVGAGLLSIVPIGQDSDGLHRFNRNWVRGGQSDTEQTCVFRFLDNDYKEPSSKSWLCIFSFRFSLRCRNNCRLFNCIFLYFALENPLNLLNRENRFPWTVQKGKSSDLRHGQTTHMVLVIFKNYIKQKLMIFIEYLWCFTFVSLNSLPFRKLFLCFCSWLCSFLMKVKTWSEPKTLNQKTFWIF